MFSSNYTHFFIISFYNHFKLSCTWVHSNGTRLYSSESGESGGLKIILGALWVLIMVFIFIFIKKCKKKTTAAPVESSTMIGLVEAAIEAAEI